MCKGKIFILSGPSGSGKTSLHKWLLTLETFKRNFVKSISMTTRYPRPGERNGRDYIFISKKMFLYKIKAGHFLEWEKLFDNYYGTPKKNVEDWLRKGKNVLLCIDVKGAKTVRQKYPSVVGVFIKTSSLNELKKRLFRRGSENLIDLKQRLKTAHQELAEAKSYDYVVINDHFNEAIQRLKSIIRLELKNNP